MSSKEDDNQEPKSTNRAGFLTSARLFSHGRLSKYYAELSTSNHPSSDPIKRRGSTDEVSTPPSLVATRTFSFNMKNKEKGKGKAEVFLPSAKSDPPRGHERESTESESGSTSFSGECKDGSVGFSGGAGDKLPVFPDTVGRKRSATLTSANIEVETLVVRRERSSSFSAPCEPPVILEDSNRLWPSAAALGRKDRSSRDWDEAVFRFWVMVEEFKVQKNLQARSHMAQVLYTQYLAPSSSQYTNSPNFIPALHMPQTILEPIANAAQNFFIPSGLFDAAQAEACFLFFPNLEEKSKHPLNQLTCVCLSSRSGRKFGSDHFPPF